MGYALPERIAERPIVIIGAGTLGRRIAAVFSSGGASVRIVDTTPHQRDAAITYANSTAPELRAAISTPNQRDLVPVTAYATPEEAVPGAWLIIEAVPELLEIKRPLFGELDRLADADAILATNSSSYASREVITEVQHPERVLNMHFAMPPQSMAVELMTDGQTDDGILQLLDRELRTCGILPFIAHTESTGFIFNRIWAAIKRESLAVVAEGVSSPEDVDAIMRANMGTSAGPFAMIDQVGLDVALNIEEHYVTEFPFLPTASRDLLRSYVEAGKLGVKSGQGFFSYQNS